MPNVVAFSNQAWNHNGQVTQAQSLSLAVHVLAGVLLMIPVAQQVHRDRRDGPEVDPIKLIFRGFAAQPPRPEPKKATGGGTGGARENEPPTVGRFAPFTWLQFTPPRLKPDVAARLQAEATLVGPPSLVPSESPYLNFGIPSADKLNNSQGPGAGGGFGDKCCGGVGTGNGRGGGPGDEWGTGDAGIPQAGSLRVGKPVCDYCPNPTFSDEAIRVRFQGSVLLRVVVTADGRAANIQIARGVGLGLDERAVEAVRTWRFHPARGPNGQPIAVWVLVEVSFRQF